MIIYLNIVGIRLHELLPYIHKLKEIYTLYKLLKEIYTLYKLLKYFCRFFVFFLNRILFIHRRKKKSMGRKKKYNTEEENRIARNILRMRYYHQNSVNEKRKALERYYKNKEL